MNLLHMKYAVTIAETKSINKAAEKLYVGQSALSRAVKELETSLGVAVFERSAKGMTLTPSGEEFIRRARSILEQVDSMENMFRGRREGAETLFPSLCRTPIISPKPLRFFRDAPTEKSMPICFSGSGMRLRR